MRITAKQAQRGRRIERGFTILEFLIVTVVIAILASIAVPNYVHSQKVANEASAIESMRALVAAEESFRLRQASPTYGYLSELTAAGLLRDALRTGSKSGYTFITFDIPSKDAYTFIAMPQGNGGDRWFYVDQSGIVRFRVGDLPDKSSPALE